jgi:hypothetical protein
MYARVMYDGAQPVRGYTRLTLVYDENWPDQMTWHFQMTEMNSCVRRSLLFLTQI